MSQVWLGFAFALGEMGVDFLLCVVSSPAVVPVANFGEGKRMRRGGREDEGVPE